MFDEILVLKIVIPFDCSWHKSKNARGVIDNIDRNTISELIIELK